MNRHGQAYIMDVPIDIDPNIAAKVEDSLASGIWARSSEFGMNEYFIFASHLPLDKVKIVLEFITNGNYKNLIGSYRMTDGEQMGEIIVEHSFIVNMKYYDQVVRLGLLDEQESILLLKGVNQDDTRNASLLFLMTGKEESIGRLTAVSYEEVEKYDAWTYDPYLDTYFIVTYKQGV